MRKTWNNILAFNSFVTLPGALMFLIYSISQLILHGEWTLLPWAIGVTFVGLVIQLVTWIILG